MQAIENTELYAVLRRRDGMTHEEAVEMILDARRRVVVDEEDPEDILYDEFGLEPDYIFDLLDM